MAAQLTPQISLLFLIAMLIEFAGVESTTFTFVNNCDYTVWPGILSNAGVAALPTTGFALQTGESKPLTVPAAWGGRFWGRTHCTEDFTGKFFCLTGDCGSGKLECSGSGASPPATLAEFTLDGSGGLDFFDVSLVDGYNLPMLVVPDGGSGRNCTSTGCAVNLNGACPSELMVMTADRSERVACRSACGAFQQPQYCCSGAYGSPETCKPSFYSELFKNACPSAYSYAYDDSTSTFTCTAADYVITFCPSPTTTTTNPSNFNKKAFPSSPAAKGAPTVGDSTMVYEGVRETSGASALMTSTKVAGLVSAYYCFYFSFFSNS